MYLRIRGPDLEQPAIDALAECTNYAQLRISQVDYDEADRTVTLPDQIDAAKVAAEYRDGVLTLRLPRAESAKARTVAIN